MNPGDAAKLIIVLQDIADSIVGAALYYATNEKKEGTE